MDINKPTSPPVLSPSLPPFILPSVPTLTKSYLLLMAMRRKRPIKRAVLRVPIEHSPGGIGREERRADAMAGGIYRGSRDRNNKERNITKQWPAKKYFAHWSCSSGRSLPPSFPSYLPSSLPTWRNSPRSMTALGKGLPIEAIAQARRKAATDPPSAISWEMLRARWEKRRKGEGKVQRVLGWYPPSRLVWEGGDHSAETKK